MPLSINEFRQTFNAEPAPTNRFEVEFLGLPTELHSQPHDILKYRIDTAELPPRSLATIQDKIYGPIRNIPYNSISVDPSRSCDRIHSLLRSHEGHSRGCRSLSKSI